MIHLQSIDGDHSHNIKEYRTFDAAEDFVTFRGNWEVTSYGSYTRPKPWQRTWENVYTQLNIGTVTGK